MKSASVGKTYSRRPGLLNLHPEKERPTMGNLNNNLKYSWTPKASPLVSKELQSSLRGFSNLGNTCYMNAILQALFGLSPFGEDLLHLARQALKFDLDNHRNTLSFALARLHNAAKNKIANEKQKQFLGEVKHAISSSAKRFSGHEQHDAHEFLSQVVDQIKEDVLKENKQVLKAKQTEHTEEVNHNIDDIHHDIATDRYINPSLLNFEFQVVHTITCLKCHEEVKKIERFNDLSIDMPKRMNADDDSSIQDALDQFFLKEQIEYTCEACQHKQVEVSHKFYRAPRVIILHLKRYHFNSMTTMNRKVGRNIKIPLYLTLWGHAEDTTYPPYYSHIRENYTSRSVLTSDENFNNTDIKDEFDMVKSTHKRKSEGFTFRSSNKAVTTSPDDDFQTLQSPNYRTALKDKPTKDDCDLQKALEQSRLESRSKKHESSFNTVEYSNGMSEEEQMRLAMEQSLHETKDTSKYFDLTANETDGTEWPDDIPAEDSEFEEKLNSVPNRQVSSGSVSNHAGINNTSTAQGLRNPRVQQLKNDLNESGYQSNNASFADEFVQDSNMETDQNAYRSPVYDMDSSVEVTNDNDNHVCSDKSSSEPSAKKIKLTTSADDLISVLERHEPKLTPEKSKQKLYATPKRLDDLFSKVAQNNNSNTNAGNTSRESGTADKKTFDLLDLCGEENDQSEKDSPVKSIKKKKPAPADIEFVGLSSDSDCDTKNSGDKIEQKSSQEKPSSSSASKIDLDTGEAVSDDRGNNMDFNILGDDADGAKITREDPDWIQNRRSKEEEDKDYKRAIEMSLLEQKPEPLGDSVDDDLKKAIELSLKDFTEAQGLPWQPDVPEEESFLSELPTLALSSEDRKRREQNMENGDLPFSYRLVSIVSHLGSSSAGHYICDVYNMDKKCWYSYDDSEVSRLSEDCVRQNRERSGYIFFYMHKELLEELDIEKKDSTAKENQENVCEHSQFQDKKPSLNKTPLKTLGSSQHSNSILNKRDNATNMRVTGIR